MENNIRETTLAQVLLKLTKGNIVKENKKYGVRLKPKYRAFSILQNDIEDVVKKSTQMWKLIYGLSTMKQGEVDPFEGKNDDKEEDEKEEENIVEEETKKKDDDMIIAKQQQDEHSVQDT